MAGFATAWVLAARNRDLLDLRAEFGPDRFLVGYAVIGAVLASRRQSNPIGWLLLGIGLASAARAVAGQYALYALTGSSRPAAAVWAAWYVNWSLTLLFPGGLLTFLLLLFPSGRLLSPRWRAVGWLAAGLSVIYLLLTWLCSASITLGSGVFRVPNPTAVRGWSFAAPGSLVSNVAWVLGWVPLLAAAASLVGRYRRSVGEERLQLKWFTYAAALSLGLLSALVPVSSSSKSGQVAFDAAVVTGIGLALPTAVGIAVLKYRLYAIDRIISRTVSYAVVTGLVVGVYLGCIALFTKISPFRGSVSVAAAVLAAAALFSPLRKRVQTVVDRRFDRARYDAERVVVQFSVQLRDEVDLDVLGADLVGVVNQVLAPTHLTLWLHDPVSSSTAPGAEPAQPVSGE